MGRDPFTWWYALPTVARRLDKSPGAIRKALNAGKFGGVPGTAACPCRHILGQWLFPWTAIAQFLGLPAETPPPDDAPTWKVRSESELRRKLVQTHGQEAIT